MSGTRIKLTWKFGGKHGLPKQWGPFLVFRTYEAEIDDPRWSFIVKIGVELVDDRFVCRETTVTARKGTELKGTERIPLASLIRHTSAFLAMGPAREGRWHALPDEGPLLEQFYAAFRKSERHGGRAPITDERLDEVASIYRANEGTRTPSKAVALALDVSESYARALVARARKAGKLDPPRRS